MPLLPLPDLLDDVDDDELLATVAAEPMVSKKNAVVNFMMMCD